MKTTCISGFMSLLFALAFSTTAHAQNDPLETVQSKAANISLYKERAMKMSPAMKAKVSAIEQEVATKKLTFTVGYTAALDFETDQLCGVKGTKQPSEQAIKAQEALYNETLKKAGINMTVESSWNMPDPGPFWYSGFMGYLPPIRDQNGCGSCWAFAVTSAFETAHKKFYNAFVDLSEEDLIDCGHIGTVDVGGCKGGSSTNALEYTRLSGAVSEADNPYRCFTRTDGFLCPQVSLHQYFTLSWGQMSLSATPEQIKNMIKAYGSVITYMRAGLNSFSGYTSGVYNGYPNTTPYDTDHAVTLVGWNDTLNAWIVRNSWGKDWGMNGYAYVNYNSCNIAKYVFYAWPKKAPVPGAVAPPVNTAQVQISPIIAENK